MLPTLPANSPDPRLLVPVNRERMRAGKPQLTYNASLADVSARNNAACHMHGCGHWVLPTGGMRGQDAAYATAETAEQAVQQFLGDDAHRAVLLDSEATEGALACDGTYATLTVN